MDALTDDERELVADAIQATKPRESACFANALQLWGYDSRFKYTEGFALASDFDVGGLEHAWCMLDGEKLVDVTTTFAHYHGAIIANEDTLQQHLDMGEVHGIYGVVGNHRNQFEFLRDQGYLDGRSE